MKKYFINIFWGCVVACMTFTACTDYLEKSPESTVSSEEAFKNFVSFQGFVEELYCCIPDFSKGYWTNSFNWGDDEFIVTTGSFHNVYAFDNGNYWNWMSEYDGWGASWLDSNDATTSMDDWVGDVSFKKRFWPLAWYGIRKANMGLENLELLTDATSEERNLIEGQLYFFRAWLHFTLMTYWGGMPYVDEVLPADQKLELPRLSCQETALRIGEDLERAVQLLLIDWDNTTAGRRTLGKNRQRINKVMAYGYLGKNYLYAGSPLMNYESTGNRGYDAEFCQKAADAFAKLLTITEGGQSHHKLVDFSEYSSLFYSQNQGNKIPGYPEVIFQAPVFEAGKTRWGLALQYLPAILGADGRCFSPTANYVNNYGMANGLPIKNAEQYDAESGYDPTDPWTGRDPRFYHDIVVDGDQMIIGTTDKESERYANLYNGGSYKSDINGSRSGYLLRKFTPDNNNDDDKGYDQNLLIHLSYMRLSDVYLMYAEAVLHGYGSPTSTAPGFGRTAVAAVNVVRERAGMPGVDAKFLGSKDDFMGEIIRERAVELSYEGHRFNDLRRWLLSGDARYLNKTAHDFDRGADGKPINLKERVVVTRVVENKHNWLPLKINDVTLYPGFGQNPGW